MDKLRWNLKFTVGHVHKLVVYLEMTCYEMRHEKLCTVERHLSGLIVTASHPDKQKYPEK